MKFPPRAQTAVVLAVSGAEIATVWDESSPPDLTLYGFTLVAVGVCLRRPVPAMLATLPVAFTGYLVLAPLFTMYQVAVAARSRAVTLVCAGLLFLVGLASYYPGEPLAEWTPEYVLMGLVSAALASTGPTALGSLARARRELSLHIAGLVEAQERERKLSARTAAAEERARLARDMHDSVSYHVSLITMRAAALERTAGGADSREAAASIRLLGSAAMTELRRMVGVLKDGPGSDGPGLRQVAALIEDSGPDVSADLGAAMARQWPAAVQEAAFRIVQEALTNVRKHGFGAAASVRAAPAAGPGPEEGLLIEIRSLAPPPAGRPAITPPTPPQNGGGHGLTGMRERAQALGGSLEAGPAPGGGFLVRAHLPARAPSTAPVPGPEQGSLR
ncbi:histidine kinase [Streptomyces sp. NPDC001584]|uniref:sensor histidine kinase n=1 Tax=Streptomyces sp. NPDC001584 TaxID=3154521 RepID=UPI00332ABE0A